MIKVYNMDVMKALKQMPDESVDMQITSPPYWGLRDYGEGVEVVWDGNENCEHEWKIIKHPPKGGKTKEDNMPKVGSNLKEQTDGISVRFGYETNICQKCGAWKGQLGLEPDFNLYIKHLADIFDEVKRVLKKDGTCWINLGDTYASGKSRYSSSPHTISGKGRNEPVNQNKPDLYGIYQDKCLCAIPERFILEMINRGWILRNKIIWHKPNHMPTSVKDRFANSWEYLFFFSKSKKYYFDLDAVREVHKQISIKRMDVGFDKKQAFNYKQRGLKSGNPNIDQQQFHSQSVNYSPKGKNPDDVIQAKFEIGDGYRQGMNRDETELIEVRPNLPTQEELTEFLSEWTNGFEKDLDEEFGEYKWRHWIRKDDGGFSYPSRKDWITLKTMLDFPDNYDKQMLFTEKKSNAIINNPLGKNPSDIIVQPYHPKGDENMGMRLPPQANQPNAFHPLGKNPSDSWKDNLRDDERAKQAREQGMFTFYSHSRRFPSQFKHADDFWDITTKGYPEAHFAVFPEKLVERPIKTTRKDAVILDIFAGSGTTLKVARDLHRDSVGIEIKKEYCDLIKKRLFGGNQPLINNFEIIK